MEHATTSAYRLPDGSRIEEALQRDGSSLWAVRRPGGSCLDKDGEWDYEPQPSSRDETFFARCRWASPEEAYEAWTRSAPAF